MEKVLKKEILLTVEEAMNQALSKYAIASPSKKTKKLLDKVARKFSSRIRSEVKKQAKKVATPGAATAKARKKDKVVLD
ncbi:hypothetical protein [Ohtaekwangia sp.]|uniref:hypothetical protein n=1 Tax=Ohtaekwangia sp. TaxID=2066019 RepID=UPI002FDE1254